MSKKTIFCINACVMSVLLLTGCVGDGDADLKMWMDQKKSEVKPKIEVIKEPVAFLPLAYTAVDQMDPFNTLKLTNILMRESENTASNVELVNLERNRRKQELENFPLDSIVMVGSLHQGGKDKALLFVNNLIYQVGTGDYIGQNYGKIIKIEENKIDLREVVQEVNGDWVERLTTLDLQEKDK